jgi:hypothetical protein
METHARSVELPALAFAKVVLFFHLFAPALARFIGVRFASGNNPATRVATVFLAPCVADYHKTALLISPSVIHRSSSSL